MVFRTLLLSLLFILPQVALGNIILVPDDQETIQAGIEAAEDGDTVLVDPGRYVETINFLGRDIVVASLYLTTGDQNYIDETIIDADGQTRVVTFQNEETEDAVLTGFTLTNGSTNYGGGIYFRGSNPTISHVIITNNAAVRVEERGGYGGGLYCTTGAHPTLNWVVIYGNSAEQDRGGIHVYNEGTATITNCIIWGNEPPELPDGLTVTYSDIESDYNGNGVIDVNPQLADPDDGDFHLTMNSPCIDAGDPNSPQDPDGTRTDIGVFYYEQIPDIVVDPVEINFGEVNIGMDRELNLTVLNLGAAQLRLDDVYIIPDNDVFVISNPQVIDDLDGGDDLRLILRFTPDQIGEATAALTIESNDPDEPQVEVHIMGIGLPPVSNIHVEPRSFNFGEVGLYDVSEQTLTISNTGEAELTVSALVVQGDCPELFSVEFEDEIVIEVDGVREIPITFTPHDLGQVRAELELQCDDPDEGVIDFPLTGTGILPERQFEFVDNTGTDHSILVLEATIMDEPLAVGSEIGIFTPAGLCCGGDYWTGDMLGLAAWGDNEITEEIDGMREEEVMSFQVWDVVTHQQYPGIPDFLEGNAIFQVNGISVVNLSVNINQGPGYMLRLTPSWNMVSLPIRPENDDVVDMWAPLVNRDLVDLIKDFLGNFYRPDFGYNGIPFWDFHQGYQVKMTEADSLWVAGEFVPEDEVIHLRDGWSMAAYFPETAVLAPLALVNIVDLLEIAKDASGHFYLPAFGYNDIPPLHRGQGYHIKVREACDLVWNVPDGMAGFQADDQLPLIHFTPVQPTGKSMSILVPEMPFRADDTEIAVFTSEGICVGASRIRNNHGTGLAIWGDDPTTQTVDGALEGESLTFMIWSTGESTVLNPTFVVGSNQYVTDSYSVIDLNDRIAVPDCLTLLDAYPNPFNSTTRLTYYLPETGRVKLTVHDITGRELMELISSSVSVGWHNVVLSSEGLPSGVLFIRLSALSSTDTRKIILLQ